MTIWQWCKDAGPIGPGLWLFDKLVNNLANINKQQPRFYTSNTDYINQLDKLYETTSK